MFRTGIGFDSHRFAPDRLLVLGGVQVPWRQGLEGHSDADVLCHAVADALLGAVALGDIGRHFPDTDPRWKDARSLDLLSNVAGLLRSGGFRVVNTDATIIAQEPRLADHVDAMRANLADAIEIGADRISVKASTAERMGAIGRSEGIAVIAVATVRNEDSTNADL